VNKLINWFYTTWLGNLYFELLLWLDRRNEKKQLRYLTPKEMAQIVRQYSLLGEGVKEVKSKVNTLIASRTKEEYDKVLKEIDDMVTLAEREANDPKAQFASFLKSNMDFSNSDIKNTTDRAKMINKRIDDMKELHKDIEKRRKLRLARQLRKEGKLQDALEIEKEFKNVKN
jgi:hypothetical protein